MQHSRAAALALGAAMLTGSLAAQAQDATPRPPWPAGDERGMGNTQGPATWQRCAAHLADPRSRAYELSHVRSNTMPQSPFAVPLRENAKPTVGIQGTRHAFNTDETVSGDPGQQGTQMDALGHFAVLPEPWDGQGELPSGRAAYYGGFTQQQVKPSPESPLQKLGIDKVPPIVTTAVLLDAKAHLGNGRPMAAGALVTAADIEAMLAAQGLGGRGLVAGDVLLIHTGWGDGWKDPDTEKTYYTKGPGLSYDAARYIESKAVVLVALDNPFTDPVAEGFLQGRAPPPAGVPDGLPFAIHHHNLVVAGIHNIQNAKLAELAADRVWLSCAIILPLRTHGASGSPVRPVAIGVPGQ